MIVNALALAFTSLLILAGVWLDLTMIHMLEAEAIGTSAD